MTSFHRFPWQWCFGCCSEDSPSAWQVYGRMEEDGPSTSHLWQQREPSRCLGPVSSLLRKASLHGNCSVLRRSWPWQSLSSLKECDRDPFRSSWVGVSRG